MKQFFSGLLTGILLVGLCSAGFFGFHINRASPLWVVSPEQQAKSDAEIQKALISGKLLFAASELAGLRWCSAFVAASVGAAQGAIIHHSANLMPEADAEARRYLDASLSAAKSYSQNESPKIFLDVSLAYALYLYDSGEIARAQSMINDALSRRAQLRPNEQYVAENLVRMQEMIAKTSAHKS